VLDTFFLWTMPSAEPLKNVFNALTLFGPAKQTLVPNTWAFLTLFCPRTLCVLFTSVYIFQCVTLVYLVTSKPCVIICSNFISGHLCLFFYLYFTLCMCSTLVFYFHLFQFHLSVGLFFHCVNGRTLVFFDTLQLLGVSFCFFFTQTLFISPRISLPLGFLSYHLVYSVSVFFYFMFEKLFFLKLGLTRQRQRQRLKNVAN